MKKLIKVLFVLLLSQQGNAQHVYQIRADSVRIYNVCDTAELIIENRTRGVNGFLYNKGNGRTEFRRIRLESIGGSQIAISGQDTLDISTLPGIGSVDTIYRSGDNILYVKRGVQHTIYAPLPSFKAIPQGVSYAVGEYPASRISGFNAYSSPDMPAVSDQALTNPGSGNNYYAGHVIWNGSAGYQMAVNWDGELTGPKGVFIRNKDDTQTTWGAWRELVFKDYADGKYWHSANHASGSAFSPVLTGANVPASFTSNASGHVTGFTTRTLTPSDIGAASAGIPLQMVLANGNTATNNIVLGANGNLNQYTYQAVRNVNATNYTASFGVAGGGLPGASFASMDGSGANSKIFYLPFNGTAPRYSPNGGVNTYDVWHSNNHAAGNAFNPDLSGAKVLEGIQSNASGHIVGINTRTLTTDDLSGVSRIAATTNPPYISPYTADLNDITNTAILHVGTATNRPTGNPGFLSAAGNSSAATQGKFQIFQDYVAEDNVWYRRGANDGSWGTWYQVASRSWVNSTFSPVTGSGNYIQNQISVAQAANAWITGGFRANGSVGVWRNGSNGIINGLELRNAAGTRGAIFQLNGDTNPGLATWTHNGSAWVKNMELTAGGGMSLYPTSTTEALRMVNNAAFVSGYNATNTTRTGYLQFNAATNSALMVDINQALRFGTNGTVRMDIAAGGNVGIGITNAANKLQIVGAGTIGLGVYNSEGISSTSGAFARFYNNGIPTAGDQRLGGVLFGPYSGASAYTGAQIEARSAAAWTAGGSHPAYLSFFVGQAGSTVLLEGARMSSTLIKNNVKTLVPNTSGIAGSGTGVGNMSWMGFYESNGTTRQGYVGIGSGSNNGMYVLSDGGPVNIGAAGLVTAVFAPGKLSLSNTTSNHIQFNNVGVAAPSFTTLSAGTKIVMYPSLSTTAVDYAQGMESSHQWYSIPQNAANYGFKWYGGTTQIARLDGTGILTVEGQLISKASTGSEGVRIQKDDGYLSVWNTANNARTGFIQFRPAGSARIYTDVAQPIELLPGGGLPAATFNVDKTLKLGNIPALATAASAYLVSNAGTISSRTPVQMLSDIGAAPTSGSGNYIQNQLSTAQSANAMINGIFRSTNQIQIYKNGSNAVVDMLEVRNAAGSRGVNFQINGDTNPGLAVWVTNAAGSWTKRMEILADGKTLMNGATNDGANTLQVNGSIASNASILATSFYQSSLRSLKKNILPFTASALSILGSAQVRTFQFKSDSTGKTNIGFIADEVPDEIAIPGRKGVDQASTVALLVKSVQELNQQNEALEQKVKNLEALVEKLLEQKQDAK
ncbi:pyocin knob domain-containing protein [Chitinophaga sp. XS-30]|uniref:pyocin knob domain-containing protein n=1 Tax=Chitinophaga sp. XS-30 TaxID=2604421 RepID=UPI0011DD81B1|nr:pyocin knob domain-containing protein [Chitinophaga sp. XS-30]QEH43306.1 tail fiber domain-containing protein [Chitinophaga sp. XS-30]